MPDQRIIERAAAAIQDEERRRASAREQRLLALRNGESVNARFLLGTQPMTLEEIVTLALEVAEGKVR